MLFLLHLRQQNATHDPCTPAINSTHAAGKDTEVSNVIAFFNPQATSGKKRRCNMLRDCFNISPNAPGGITIACKSCLNFGVSNCFLVLLEQLIYSHTIVLSSSPVFRSGCGGPSMQLMHKDIPYNVQEWQLKCVLVSFRIVRLEN